MDALWAQVPHPPFSCLPSAPSGGFGTLTSPDPPHQRSSSCDRRACAQHGQRLCWPGAAYSQYLTLRCPRKTPARLSLKPIVKQPFSRHVSPVLWARLQVPGEEREPVRGSQHGARRTLLARPHLVQRQLPRAAGPPRPRLTPNAAPPSLPRAGPGASSEGTCAA